jgi:hypothetical protein
MIELIFALVIMSIVFISLPMVLVNNQNSLEDNLVQESIFLASSKMSQVLTFKWDDNSSSPGLGTLSTSDVIDVTNGAPALDRNSSEFRVGHFQQDKHRRMSPQLSATRSATAVLGIEVPGVFDDIDDFHGLVNTNIIATTSAGGYKKQYRADVNVTYVNDNNFINATSYASNSIDFVLSPTPAAAVTTNIKMVSASISQDDPTSATGWKQTLLLRAFVANIGETDYFKRRY